MRVRAPPDPNAFEWPSPAEGDEFEDPLFDSRRDYLDQADRYARFKGRVIRERQGPGPKKKAYGETRAIKRAEEAIAANPEKLNRDIANELGIPLHTVRRASRRLRGG